MAEEGGGDHAPGDGFAVLVAAIGGDALESVSEGVAEIQDFAQAGFAFIAADDAGLDGDIARDKSRERLRIALENFGEIAFEEFEHAGVGDDGVLDDFGEAATEFAVGKSAQEIGIGEDEFRRVEGTNEVLPFREIYAGFAADGAVCLSDERGGNVDKPDAAKIGSRGETGDVTDNSTANGDEKRLAVGARSGQGTSYLFGAAEIFCRFGIIE